ncbi:polysaccharide deacetylase family protein [Flavobacterium sp. HSC-61S13]|uniref:polysaccharide deacetylase family protein n=1 Tax=Flavobacterium sp. HSC-61S13 TaxID=2910963 RepID=UPI00209D3259|nr:polysaccharide deacetylase family protein [Flavobacterium sp. HSC-61S13]MCP1994985.1 peptidoglycan/xylan/chitin deacetylase (PgdA/CDA1 family) [Flavobacterium sp. HSC-61S13]
MFAKIPFLIPLLFPKQLWAVANTDKKIYLSFDDGPIPEITEWVLDLLDFYQIKATFFCIGDNIEKHPEIFRKIIAAQHQIGNHTQHHINGWKTETSKYIEEVLLCTKKIEKHTKASQHLFRPPYGKIKTSQAKVLLKKNYKIVMWTVLSKDYDAKTSPEQCLQNVVKHTRSGSIILFHDSWKASQNLKHALPKAIEYLLKEGYQFELL